MQLHHSLQNTCIKNTTFWSKYFTHQRSFISLCQYRHRVLVVPYSEPVSRKPINRTGWKNPLHLFIEGESGGMGEISQVRMSDFVSRLRKRTLWESEIPPTTPHTFKKATNVTFCIRFISLGGEKLFRKSQLAWNPILWEIFCNQTMASAV